MVIAVVVIAMVFITMVVIAVVAIAPKSTELVTLLINYDRSSTRWMGLLLADGRAKWLLWKSRVKDLWAGVTAVMYHRRLNGKG